MTDKCEYCGQETRYGHNSVCVMNEVAELRTENERLRAENELLRDVIKRHRSIRR
jgi:ribosomal protein L24E